MDNNFYIESYDEELRQKIRFHYWLSDKGYCYGSYEQEDGYSVTKRISEQAYISALEEKHNA